MVIIGMAFISKANAQTPDSLFAAQFGSTIQSAQNKIQSWQDTLNKNSNASLTKADQMKILGLFSDFLFISKEILDNFQKAEKENKELNKQLEITKLKLEIANMRLRRYEQSDR